MELSSHFAFGTPDFLFLMRVCRKASAVALGGKHIFYSPVCVQRVGSLTAPRQILCVQSAIFTLLASGFSHFASRFSVIVLALFALVEQLPLHFFFVLTRSFIQGAGFPS